MNKYLIPNTLGFTITEDGQVFDPAGVKRNHYKNGDGYTTASVVDSDGVWKTFGLHRLLAMTFIKCYGNPDEMTVNHIDLNRENNAITNLEWVTVAQNNMHAAISTGTELNPKLLFTGISKPSILVANFTKASEILKVPLKTVWDAVKYGDILQGYKLSFWNDKMSKPKELHKNNYSGIGLNRKDSSIAIDVMNLENGCITTFPSFYAAAKHFNVSPSIIYRTMTTPDKVRLFKRNFIVMITGSVFPEISPEQLEVLRNPTGKEVLARRLDEQSCLIFESAAEFIREAKLSKKTVTTNLKNNRIKVTDNWIYVYRSDENLKRLLSFTPSDQ